MKIITPTSGAISTPLGKQARVPGREDTGVVIEWACQAGAPGHQVKVARLHFVATGEVLTFAISAVELID